MNTKASLETQINKIPENVLKEMNSLMTSFKERSKDLRIEINTILDSINGIARNYLNQEEISSADINWLNQILLSDRDDPINEAISQLTKRLFIMKLFAVVTSKNISQDVDPRLDINVLKSITKSITRVNDIELNISEGEIGLIYSMMRDIMENINIRADKKDETFSNIASLDPIIEDTPQNLYAPISDYIGCKETGKKQNQKDKLLETAKKHIHVSKRIDDFVISGDNVEI